MTRKIVSRGPVHPIPVPTISHRIISSLSNDRTNQETFELQPSIGNNTSDTFNIVTLNVPNYNQDIPDGNGSSRDLGQENISEESLPSRKLSINLTKFDTFGGLTLNNRKFNKNLISIGGLIFLFAMLVIILIPSWLAHETKNAEKLYVLFFVLLCALPLGLPTIYFVLNPKHLLIALKDLPCIR